MHCKEVPSQSRVLDRMIRIGGGRLALEVKKIKDDEGGLVGQGPRLV